MMNTPSYHLVDTYALVDLQALIREALQSDAAAAALDNLLSTKLPAYQLTALAIAYKWLKPYEVK